MKVELSFKVLWSNNKNFLCGESEAEWRECEGADMPYTTE